MSKGGQRTVHKSDPIVLELLKKDPSTWNAKERRMVKRYQQRNHNQDDTTTTETAAKNEDNSSNSAIEPIPTNSVESIEKQNDDKSNPKNIEETNEETAEAQQNDDEDDGSDDSSTSNSSSSSNSSAGSNENAIKMQNNVDSSSSSDDDDDDSEAKKAISTKKVETKKPDILNPETSPSISEEDQPQTMGKVPKDHEIWKVLDKLNSKQKRTLTRKLDRLGASVLDEVEQEANTILDAIDPIVTAAVETEAAQKRDSSNHPASTVEPTTKKRRKTKAAPDWSSLPPEERLRREEQRRKQQEAAERRARGEQSIKPGHKRPLNSARRRANRRKPKWATKASPARGAPDISDYKKEHHSSGFFVRKRKHQVAATGSSQW